MKKNIEILGEQDFELPVSTQEQWWSVSYFINSAFNLLIRCTDQQYYSDGKQDFAYEVSNWI